MQHSNAIKNDRRFYTPDNIDRIYRIPTHRDFGITVEGSVYHLKSNERLEWVLRQYSNDFIIPSVILENDEIIIPRLLCETFVGPLQNPKGYSLIPGGRWHRSRDVGWAYENVEIKDTNTIFIDNEEFRRVPINELTDYFVSAYGVIFNSRTQDFTHVRANTQGYMYAYLYDTNSTNGENKILMAVHRLVYVSWIGNIPDGLTIDHDDNDYLNNYYKNLKLLTRAENSAKAYVSGGNAQNLKWTKDQVRQICELMNLQYRKGQIAEKLGIPNDASFKRLVGRLRQALRHKDIVSVYSDIGMCVENSVFDHDTIVQIAELMQNEGIYDEREICERVGLAYDKKTHNRIGQIRRKETYSAITKDYDFSGYSKHAWNSRIKSNAEFEHLCAMLSSNVPIDEILVDFAVPENERDAFINYLAKIRRGEIRPDYADKYQVSENAAFDRDVKKKECIGIDEEALKYGKPSIPA